jgi:hypothetical protein
VGVESCENSVAQLARWARFIESLEIGVPPDKGMLWSKLDGSVRAQALAEREGLVCLEMILRGNGFLDRYDTEFGVIRSAVTAAIWRMVSLRYVRALKGRVTAYVHRKAHFAHINEAAVAMAGRTGIAPTDATAIHKLKQQHNPNDPVLVAEEEEICNLLLKNTRITELALVDIETGECFGGRTAEIQEWFRRAELRA